VSDKKSSESRRNLLKSIAAGGGAIVAGKTLPEKWTAPVVDSVLLPAHAQTSPAPTTTVAPTTTAAPCTPCLVAATYCEGQGEGSMSVTVAENGTVTVDHSVGSDTDTVDPCTGGDFSVTLTSAGAAQIVISGNIPCGSTDTINVDVNGSSIPLLQSLCLV